MAEFTAYIDEAGDLGINRGTKWFVLSAAIVAKTDEAAIRNRMAAIRTRLNINEIHLRKVNDFQKRAYIVRELAEMPFTYMNVLVDTSLFDNAKIPNPQIAYNFICKYLLQRISMFMCDRDAVCDIVLSARGTSRDGELITYLKDKLLPYRYNRIDETRFDKVKAKTASCWEMLQLADVCATTMFFAYEINAWGFTVPCYSMAFANHLYRKNNRVTTYGIKFFQETMKPDLKELRSYRICAQKERTPGATTT